MRHHIGITANKSPECANEIKSATFFCYTEVKTPVYLSKPHTISVYGEVRLHFSVSNPNNYYYYYHHHHHHHRLLYAG